MLEEGRIKEQNKLFLWLSANLYFAFLSEFLLFASKKACVQEEKTSEKVQSDISILISYYNSIPAFAIQPAFGKSLKSKERMLTCPRRILMSMENDRANFSVLPPSRLKVRPQNHKALFSIRICEFASSSFVLPPKQTSSAAQFYPLFGRIQMGTFETAGFAHA